MNRLTIGQFCPADSPLHRLDPRSKLIAGLLFMVAALLVHNFAGLLLLFGGVLLTLVISKVPYRRALGGFRVILYILIFTVLIHTLSLAGAGAVRDEGTASARAAVDGLTLVIGPVAVTAEGFLDGVFFAFRLALLVLGTSILTLTTPALQLGEAIESSLRPLRRARFPVEEVALTISLSLRFLPTLFSEAERIRRAQMARGADFAGGGIVSRGRTYLALLIPMLVSALRRARDVGLSLESRCYRAEGPRTRLHELVWEKRDTLAVSVVLLCLTPSLIIGRLPLFP